MERILAIYAKKRFFDKFRFIGYPLHSEPQPPGTLRAAAVAFWQIFCYNENNKI